MVKRKQKNERYQKNKKAKLTECKLVNNSSDEIDKFLTKLYYSFDSPTSFSSINALPWITMDFTMDYER